MVAQLWAGMRTPIITDILIKSDQGIHSSILAWEIPCRVTKSRTRPSTQLHTGHSCRGKCLEVMISPFHLRKKSFQKDAFLLHYLSSWEGQQVKGHFLFFPPRSECLASKGLFLQSCSGAVVCPGQLQSHNLFLVMESWNFSEPKLNTGYGRTSSFFFFFHEPLLNWNSEASGPPANYYS